MSCSFCSGVDSIESKYHSIKFDKSLFDANIAIYSKSICPPFANCCNKNMNVATNLRFNYCPMCGTKLN